MYNQLTPFQASTRIIMDIVAQIQWAINGLMRRKSRIQDEELKKTICFHVLLLVWEFNEEWKVLESISKGDERLRVLSPAIRRIRKWGKGLDIVRNQFLGHARHRDKQKNFILIKSIFENPKVPTAFAEMLLLGKLAEISMNWLCNLYPVETKKCTDWLMSQGVVKSSKGVRTIAEAEGELKLVNDEIKNPINQANLKLGNPITGEFRK